MTVLAMAFAVAHADPQDAAGAVTITASYTGDLVSTLSGGLQRGSAYLGMGTVAVSFDPEKAGLWQGGLFHLHAAGTHGARPSMSMIGDLQVASNIEAGNHLYVQELWYGQRWGAAEFIVGLQDLNVHFAQNENTPLYLNSSFGVPSTFSMNSPVSIFPLTSLGLSAIWTLANDLALKGALFDGSPTSFEHNPHNLQWHVGNDDGVFFVGELQYGASGDTAGGPVIRLGAYRHSHRQADDPGGREIDVASGVYAMIDETVWRGTDGKSIALFARTSVCPGRGPLNPFFAGGGVNLRGLLTADGSDVLGFACAHAVLRDIADETTLELTYLLPVADHCAVHPDLQYIINPGAGGGQVDPCLVGTLRFTLNL